MDIDDKSVRRPDRMKRRSVGAKCCLVVVVLLGSIFGLLIGKTFYDVYKFSTMPHKDMLSPPEVNGTRKARLAPIIDTDTRFDVGITLWAQKDAVDTSESVLREEEYKSFFKETDGKARLGDEVELFSDIVLHDIGLSSKHTQVNISYTLPLQFNRGKPMSFSVRAAVVLIPRDPSFLGGVRDVSSVWPLTVDLPLLGEGLINTGRVGEPDSIERRAIEAMALPISLIKSLFVQQPAPGTSKAIKVDEEMDFEDDEEAGDSPNHPSAMFLITRVNAYIIKETRMMDYMKVTRLHSRAKRILAGMNNVELAIKRLTPYGDYGDDGHTQSRFDLALDDENADGAYPPYLGTFVAGKFSRRMLKNSTEEQDDSMNASLTLSFAPMNPGRVLLMDELNNGRPSLHFHDEDDIDHSKGGPQRAELWENLFLGVAAGRTPEGARPWRVVIYYVATGLLSFIGLLETVYWYTRGTSTGISTMAAWWSFATPFVQCLSIHVVNKIKEGSKTDQLNYLEYTIATAFLLVIPLLQLRVVLPYTLSKENGRWGLRRWVFNHSERATARKDVTWALAFKMALGFFAVYQAFNHYSMYLVSPASYHNNITGVVNLGKLDTWTKLVLASTINVHMAVETTSLVSQLILNHRCRSFAGTYAVLAYTQLVLAVSRVLAHDYFLATDYLFKGLHANHLVEIAIAAVTAYQAATLPRVEQNVIDEQEE